jgi:hypothetical protein
MHSIEEEWAEELASSTNCDSPLDEKTVEKIF